MPTVEQGLDTPVLFQPLSGILPPDARHHAVPQVNLAVARDTHRVGRQVPVLHRMPERGKLEAQRWIGTPIWTVCSETETRIPGLNRTHVA